MFRLRKGNFMRGWKRIILINSYYPSRKFHYFDENGMSLCRKWSIFNVSGASDEIPTEACKLV